MSTSDFYLVDPQGWEYDLLSVYSAYMGHFQLHGVPWYDRTWGQFFETFEQFLAFSWPVVTITDARTGRAHIVTRKSSIAAFLRMIKTRFGEALPEVDNVLHVKPLETSQRHLRHISEGSTYKKLNSTLPAVALAALKTRVRMGEPASIRELWATRDKTFLALDFEYLEKAHERRSLSPVPWSGIVEWGYAVIRSNHLDAVGAWPPSPDENYRKGHYVIAEYGGAPDAGNKATSPKSSGQYIFGDSQVVARAKLPRIVESVLSSLLSPDSEIVANDVVLVAHGVQAVLQRLEDMKIKLPSNVLILDIAYLERGLFNTGERGPMRSRKSGIPRLADSLLSLQGILHSFGMAPPCALHNAGNRAFMSLVAFQRMVDPRQGVTIQVPPVPVPNLARSTTTAGAAGGKAGSIGRASGVRRAATVAARLFRPLSTGTVNAVRLDEELGVINGGNKDSDRLKRQQQQVRASTMGGQQRVSTRGVTHGTTVAGMNETMNAHVRKRVSVMSAQSTTTTVGAKPPRVQWEPPHENEKLESIGSDSGSGPGHAYGWWAPSMIPLSGQRRHSTLMV